MLLQVSTSTEEGVLGAVVPEKSHHSAGIIRFPPRGAKRPPYTTWFYKTRPFEVEKCVSPHCLLRHVMRSTPQPISMNEAEYTEKASCVAMVPRVRPQALELDETVCNRAVCQHPQCWVTLRRIEQGHPRLRPPPSVSRHHPRDGGGLPTLSVTTLPSDQILPDGVLIEGYRGGAPATPSTTSCSMEKIFFPGVNSFKEIIAPPRASGSSLSYWKPQKMEILRPSFQDTRSRDVTMVWVPNPQNTPPKTQDREKPLKVWIKDLSLTDQLGGMKREMRNPAPTINKKKKNPTNGSCPLKRTLVGSSPLPHTKNLMAAHCLFKDAQEQTEEAVKCRRRPHEQWPDIDSPSSPSLTGMIVENRRVILHDAREKCPIITHTGPVYRMDQQSAALNNMSNMEIDLDSITNQYYLWKKYIHLGGPNRRFKPPDRRLSKTGKSYNSLAPDHLGHIGLFPYDRDSALSYYKSQALVTPTGSLVCDTTRSQDSESRNSASLAGFSQRSWTDEESSKAPADMNARKQAQQEIAGERNKEMQQTEPPQAMSIAPERPDQEKKDVPGDDKSTRAKTSPDAAESTAKSTDVHENAEQRTSSPQPNPPPPTPMY
ncbi:uncharacterized protein C9orf43 homolog isoform X2 [Dendrobates tinctorius]|uniref:uncharacterized protein C9orf43 homolog isoform X2 n=1 Tax=Dendrobates tinctorius TaxID=92724 RepID=UPI003CC9C8D4